MFHTFIRNSVLSLLTLAFLPTAQAINWGDYDHLDPQHLVPLQALQQALHYFDQIKSKITNPHYLTVIDYTQSSSQRRFYVINLKSGSVETLKVAHGVGSDKNHDGWAESFSNKPNSKASSLGFYLTSTTYNGSNGLSLILDGLSLTNSNARNRAIVIHGADYVNDQRKISGRSWGCPALDQKSAKRIIQALKEGSLIYAWGGQSTKS